MPKVDKVLINVNNKPQSANGDNLSRLSVNAARPRHICMLVMLLSSQAELMSNA